MAAPSSILAWRIPWTEELVGYSPWGGKSRARLSTVSDRAQAIESQVWQGCVLGVRAVKAAYSQRRCSHCVLMVHKDRHGLCGVTVSFVPSLQVHGEAPAWKGLLSEVGPSQRCLCAQSLQSCPTLCNPMDHSLLGSSIRGILQAKILEWIAIPFSRGSSRPRDRTWVSHMAGGLFTI